MELNYNILYSQLFTLTENLSVSELHGVISATVCLHKSQAYKYLDWDLITGLAHDDSKTLSSSSISENNQLKNLCEDICEATYDSINSNLFEFDILLPNSDIDVDLRVEELAAWSRGFSYAMIKALALKNKSPNASYSDLGLSEIGVEALKDINDVSQVETEELGDIDEAEDAYAEIAEYLRIATQTIYDEISALTENSKLPHHNLPH